MDRVVARRGREANVFCEVHPCDVSSDWVRAYAADGKLKGIILSGSHASVYEESTDAAPQAVFELDVPVLGICYGMQTMAQQLGGKVEGGSVRQLVYAAIKAEVTSAVLKEIPDAVEDGHQIVEVWMVLVSN